jgi:hypothetical protein
MVTTAIDSKGVTERLVSVASIRLKALRFDTDPELQCFLAIRMVLVVLRTAVLAVAGNARRSLEWILPTSYRSRQEENEENEKYFEEERSFVVGFDSNAVQLPHAARARKGCSPSPGVATLHRGESFLEYHQLVRDHEKQKKGRKPAPPAVLLPFQGALQEIKSFECRKGIRGLSRVKVF